MLTFLVVHVYLITTGHTVTSNLTGMLTGSEELEDESNFETTESENQVTADAGGQS